MSFIDLMSNDQWTAADIQRRTEFIIRSDFSLEDETILNRKALGMALGTYELTEAEAYELQRYTAVAENARVEYDAAFADMNLLNSTFKYEEAMKVLAPMPLTEAIEFVQTERPAEVLNEQGEVTNIDEINEYDTKLNEANNVIATYGEDVERNESDRATAQDLIDNSAQEVKDLFLLRNPQG